MPVDTSQAEDLFLCLSDHTRIRLIYLLKMDGELTVSALVDALGESQPKTSRHLAYLRNAGLVDIRRDGKQIFYSIAKGLTELEQSVVDLTARWFHTEPIITVKELKKRMAERKKMRAAR